MANQSKIIITCAVTGAIHTPSMSPYLPVTHQEIADAAVGAAEAGLFADLVAIQGESRGTEAATAMAPKTLSGH